MSFTITQNLFIGDSTAIAVVKCNDDALQKQHLQYLFDGSSGVLGISATYGEHCRLSSIAFSTLSRALVVNVSTRRSSQLKGQSLEQRRVARSRSLIQDHLLLNSDFQKFTFRMDQVATSLYLDMSIRISDAVDMLSVSTDGRHSLQALVTALGGETELVKENVKSLFFDNAGPSVADSATRVALKAWAACRAANLPHMSPRFATLPRVNTMTFSKADIIAIASIFRNADCLEALKPTFTKNDVTSKVTMKKGTITLCCNRFPTRIKTSTNQVIHIEMKDKETTCQVTGRVRKVNGRNADIGINGSAMGNKVLSVMTIGKDDLTCAESSREAIILATLQHKSNILLNPFFQALWLPNERLIWPKSKQKRGPSPVDTSCSLNTSQRKAVQKILSDEESDRIVLVQGPPGTGKTTVIAAAISSHHHVKSGWNIWVAAQSNVAVKNIAEKFIKEGFRNFKLLVSKDFHFDWHEHLYEELQPCLVRSDNFPKSVVEASRVLLDCNVVLCTLSMFSNPSLGVFLQILPVEMIILDEASQIECGNYLPLFHSFHSTLSKIVFIGDDKQLPPYGQEDIPGLRSVFEISHLRGRALFLDTQYRMPHVVGTFISRNVYNNKLRTIHRFTTSKACQFVDVNKGREVKMGHSWTNPEEAHVIVKLVRFFQSKNMAFRIVTPYDAQRSLIERYIKLDKGKLPWKDKVFNVDSFQGNEDDHIIVSVVRSRKPGFLKNQRRTNVMLTRCKQSMVICSSRSFLFGKGSETLVGKLAAELGEANWVNGNDIAGLCFST